jgi:hypothetical protein
VNSACPHRRRTPERRHDPYAPSSSTDRLAQRQAQSRVRPGRRRHPPPRLRRRRSAAGWRVGDQHLSARPIPRLEAAHLLRLAASMHLAPSRRTHADRQPLQPALRNPGYPRTRRTSDQAWLLRLGRPAVSRPRPHQPVRARRTPPHSRAARIRPHPPWPAQATQRIRNRSSRRHERSLQDSSSGVGAEPLAITAQLQEALLLFSRRRSPRRLAALSRRPPARDAQQAARFEVAGDRTSP